MYQNFNGIYKFIGKLSRMVISLLILLIFNFSLMNLKYLYLSEKNVALFQPSKLKEVTDLTLKELSFPFGFIIGITRAGWERSFIFGSCPGSWHTGVDTLWLVIKHRKTWGIYVRGRITRYQEPRLRTEKKMREKAMFGHLYCFSGLFLSQATSIMKSLFLLLVS